MSPVSFSGLHLSSTLQTLTKHLSPCSCIVLTFEDFFFLTTLSEDNKHKEANVDLGDECGNFRAQHYGMDMLWLRKAMAKVSWVFKVTNT